MTNKTLFRVLLVCSILAWVGLMLNVGAIWELVPVWSGTACVFAAVIAAFVAIVAWSWGEGDPS